MGIKFQGYSGLPGGGPWRILTNCPAPNHNSKRAAEGRGGLGRCVCPRGLDLYRERQESQGLYRKRKKERLRAEGKPITPPRPGLPRGEITIPMPDLSAGRCRKKWNISTVDAAIMGNAGVPAMKQLCEDCPVLDECRDYVIAAERPQGSWGGVWGGLAPREHFRMTS
jgi:hypothetical protein